MFFRLKLTVRPIRITRKARDLSDTLGFFRSFRGRSGNRDAGNGSAFLKLILTYAAQGADKAIWKTFSLHAGSVVRVAGGLIANPTANGTSVNLQAFLPSGPYATAYKRCVKLALRMVYVRKRLPNIRIAVTYDEWRHVSAFQVHATVQTL